VGRYGNFACAPIGRPGLTGLVGDLLNDPPGFDRSELPAVDHKIAAFFRKYCCRESTERVDVSRHGYRQAPQTSIQQMIREFRAADEDEVVDVWHRSGVAAYPYLPTWQAFTLEQARGVFERVIRPRCAIWVATGGGRVVAYLAMKETYIDRLYVDPAEWRKGWGTRLVNFAKQLSPRGLELHTHRENHAARALYEHHGFKAVKFSISPPPESAPDVEYHWRPE
jgi:ribosomal protein S18 acetylase RimI-like enzyme